MNQTVHWTCITDETKSLTDGFERYRKKTRKEQFLDDMVVATAANVHDSVVRGDLLHGEETRVWGDSAYIGKRGTITDRAPNVRDFTQDKGNRHRKLTEDERDHNRSNSRVRAKVEHVFGVMKGRFGFTKVRYKGLAKNAHYCSSPARW